MKKRTMAIVIPNIGYHSQLMPKHPQGHKPLQVNNYRASTGFGRKNPGTLGHYVDKQIEINLPGVPLDRKIIVNTIESYVKMSPKFGTRGGKNARATAERYYSNLKKEGLIVEFVV